jgi:hypothetical protein
MREKAKIFNTLRRAQCRRGHTGSQVEPVLLSVDFSMERIEILQPSDGTRSGSMGLDH